MPSDIAMAFAFAMSAICIHLMRAIERVQEERWAMMLEELDEQLPD